MQKTFKNQQGREFLLLDLPSDYSRFRLKEDKLFINHLGAWLIIIRDLGNYQILCLAKNATEELASEIVHYTLKDGYLKCYYNYVVKHYTHSLFDAKESLTSLLTSLGFKQDNNILILEKI